MSGKEGKFFTRGTTKVEHLDRGTHHWFSRPDITGSEDLMVTRVDVEPGNGHPFHRHPTMDEVIYIISGSAEQWIGQEARNLGAGEAAFIPKNKVHATYNSGPETLCFLAMLSPAADLEGSMIYVYEEEPWRSLKEPL
ncbi:MAG: cupin domain-containing protein [Balneolales bacterium]